jgi:hypothetical protein
MTAALPKPTRQLDSSYLKWIRTQRCYYVEYWADYRDCDGPIDAHHVVPVGGGKVGSKTDDRRSVPACRRHHQWAENNPQSFRGIFDAEKLISKLNAKYDAEHPPKPKVSRAITPTVKTLLIKCDCGRTHRIASAKIQLVMEPSHAAVIKPHIRTARSAEIGGVRYYCWGKMKGWKVAKWG